MKQEVVVQVSARSFMSNGLKHINPCVLYIVSNESTKGAGIFLHDILKSFFVLVCFWTNDRSYLLASQWNEEFSEYEVE